MNRYSLSACGALILGVACAVLADSMRCGVHLVTEGDHKFNVAKICGQPDASESYVIADGYSYRDRRGRLIAQRGVKVDVWLYRNGPQRFDRILRFENGRLRRIERDRG